MRHPALRWVVGLGLGVLAAGCPPGQQNVTTEADSEGCTPGEQNCVCADDGCDPGLVCSGGVCVADEGTTTATTLMTTATTSVTDGTTSTTDSTATTGSSGDSSTTSTPECTDGPGPSDQCPKEKQFCEGGACVDCTGIASCADYDPANPVCDQSTGGCVECTESDASACGGTTPVCDPAAKVCVKCSAHDQCTSGACDLESGACFPEDSVLWVDRAVAQCGVGTQESPFCEIQDAVKSIGPNSPTVVKVIGGAMTYKTKIDVVGGATVAIVAASGTPTVDVNIDALLINNGARVFLQGIKFVGTSMTAAKGIFCVSADLWATQVDISSRESIAVDAIGCDLRFDRARVYLNTGGGVQLNGGKIWLANSFIASNGGLFSERGGIHLSGSAGLDAVYTTVIGNNADTSASSLHCPSPGPVVLRNSALFGATADNSVNCPGALATDSYVDAMVLAGEGVTVVPKYDTKWFKNPALGDFHVTELAPFKTAAKWRPGDPVIDYDGDPRPAQDLAPDWAGADRL